MQNSNLVSYNTDKALTQPWYEQLVEDCKAILIETEFTARWALVEGYWRLGERMRQDGTKRSITKLVQDLGVVLHKSESTLWYAVQFYDKYPALDKVPEGKAISWNKLVTKYLPERAEVVRTFDPSKPLHEGVIHGDALIELPKIDQKSVDMAYADMPYNLGKADWDTFKPEEFEQFTIEWLTVLLPCLKDQAHLFIHISADKVYWLDGLVRQHFNLVPVEKIIWNHRNLVHGSDAIYKLLNTYQPILHYCFGEKPLNFSPDWNDERFDVWNIATPQSNTKDRAEHPTQKPLELMERIVRLGSKPGELVLDPFAGAGTTALACKNNNRAFITIEKNDLYIPVIQRRLV